MPEFISAALHHAPPMRLSRPASVIIGLSLALMVVIGLFMTLDAKGSWSFVLGFRGTKLAALALVACAIATSTVLFQTITANRILTPSIIGFDALYVLIQTALVFTIGSRGIVQLSTEARFLAEIALMVGFASLLYRWLFGGRQSLYLLLMVGVVFGVLFRSASGLMQRLIDPNEYAILQDMLFASFNSFDRDLLPLSAALIGGALALAWRLRHTLDVLLLGRESAISLGVAYQRSVALVLGLVAVLVSVSTALVGPVTFFGLLVANLAYHIIGTYKHLWVIPCAALLAILTLVGGQLVVERMFGFTTSLSIIVEFIGGIVFIILLIRGANR